MDGMMYVDMLVHWTHGEAHVSILVYYICTGKLYFVYRDIELLVLFTRNCVM